MLMSDSDMYDSENSMCNKTELIETKLWKLVKKLEDITGDYYNYDNIKREFIKSLERNDMGPKNKCIECGIDMGYTNPGQLCGKYKCTNKL